MAYPLTEVSKDAVGGSEQILTILDRTLTEAGHRSIVLAAEGSKVQGKLIASPRAKGVLDDTVRDWGMKVHRQLIKEALTKYAVDLVHMHSLDFHCYVPVTGIPVLSTLHLPPSWYPKSIFQKRFGRFHMNCVSWSQHRSCPRSPHLLEPIPNGVDIDRLYMKLPRGNFALAMGRICPEKGFHYALDAACMAGMELRLAGEVFPYESHLAYFQREISPRLSKTRTFIGPVGFAKKRRLLAQAKCLLIPSTVAETSSLVAMEALACGTPVIAYRSGALPEIIEHGRTGFLVSSVKEMSQALREVGRLESKACLDAARERYSSRLMAARYLNLYRRLIDGYGEEQIPGANGRISQWAASR